ncbi:P1 family peptidase [Acuticoccus kandeliae]|uniref:P1 family peptidase n=1 Tax=Acuticoccus kandeliae TaxID=2073160 RepID=UPI000D3E2487|nr:P1 family peptidase [Acuticoccus kandeliae]
MSHLLDVPGLRVGHASDAAARSGVTTIVMDEPAVCGVAVHGGAPGTRETDALQPEALGAPVDAVCLSGGSAFGLAAADGVQLALAERGRGFAVGIHKVPIVPGAIIFDLSGPRPDYRALGAASVAAALDGAPDRTLGTIGAGMNAMSAGLKGGLGSASMTIGDVTVAAIVVANPVGAVTAANGPWFRAAPFEVDGEFGGLVAPPDADFATVRTKHSAGPRANTMIGLVATDARLTRGEAKRLAITAHDGMALAVFPSHTILDGDTLFAVSTARAPAPAGPRDHIALGAAAATTVARAISRAIFHARAVEGDRFPTWQSLYGGA